MTGEVRRVWRAAPATRATVVEKIHRVFPPYPDEMELALPAADGDDDG